jgi:hypothetical protein
MKIDRVGESESEWLWRESVFYDLEERKKYQMRICFFEMRGPFQNGLLPSPL